MKSITKKLITSILIFIIILSSFNTAIEATNLNTDTVSNNTNNAIVENKTDLDINSEAAILIESKTRKCFIQ
jgi:hypothetical protein